MSSCRQARPVTVWAVMCRSHLAAVLPLLAAVKSSLLQQALPGTVPAVSSLSRLAMSIRPVREASPSLLDDPRKLLLVAST